MANTTAAAVRTRDCEHCGRTFSYTPSRGSDRKYCGPVCRNKRRQAASVALRESRGDCSVDSCSKPRRSGNAEWCEMHYYRMRRNGSLEPIGVAPTGHCHHCGRPTPRPQRIYCSSVCQTRNRIGAEFTGRNCIVCETAIPHEDNYLRRYCSRPCQDLAARLRHYGISIAEYRAMESAQAGRCAICGSDDERLVIDHCHEQNTVRGLLCGGCNAGIGMLREDPAILAAAITYLR